MELTEFDPRNTQILLLLLSNPRTPDPSRTHPLKQHQQPISPRIRYPHRRTLIQIRTPTQLCLHLLRPFNPFPCLIHSHPPIPPTLDKRYQSIHHRPISHPRIRILTQLRQRFFQRRRDRILRCERGRESCEENAVQRARGSAHGYFEGGDELSYCLGETGEIFSRNEREDLFCAVAEGISAIAISDDCVVFGDCWFSGYDCVATRFDPFADGGVGEGHLGC